MEKLILLLLLFIPLLSCAGDDKPLENYLNDDEIIELLVDLSIARAAVSQLPAEIGDSIRVGYYEQIATIRNIQVEQIDLTLEQLSKDPVRFQLFLNSAADSIRARNERRE